MLDAVTTPATLNTQDTPGSSVPTFQVKTPFSISESPKTSMFISEGSSLVTTTSFRGTLQVFSTWISIDRVFPPSSIVTDKLLSLSLSGFVSILSCRTSIFCPETVYSVVCDSPESSSSIVILLLSKLVESVLSKITSMSKILSVSDVFVTVNTPSTVCSIISPL